MTLAIRILLIALAILLILGIAACKAVAEDGLGYRLF